MNRYLLALLIPFSLSCFGSDSDSDQEQPTFMFASEDELHQTKEELKATYFQNQLALKKAKENQLALKRIKEKKEKLLKTKTKMRLRPNVSKRLF